MDADDKLDSGHKILVISPPHVGKTCYIKRYVDGTEFNSVVDGVYDVRELNKQTMGGRLL